MSGGEEVSALRYQKVTRVGVRSSFPGKTERTFSFTLSRLFSVGLFVGEVFIYRVLILTPLCVFLFAWTEQVWVNRVSRRRHALRFKSPAGMCSGRSIDLALTLRGWAELSTNTFNAITATAKRSWRTPLKSSVASRRSFSMLGFCADR